MEHPKFQCMECGDIVNQTTTYVCMNTCYPGADYKPCKGKLERIN